MSFVWVSILKILFVSYFFKFSYSSLRNRIKNDKISDDFLKVHYLVKRLTLRLIKLNSITVVLYFLYMSAYQTDFQFKNSQKFWWILIVYHNVSRFYGNQKSSNICVFLQILLFLFAQVLGRSNLNLTHFPINNQDSSKFTKIFELKVQ